MADSDDALVCSNRPTFQESTQEEDVQIVSEKGITIEWG